MIVVAIIGLLAALAVPSFLRARQRSQATDVLNDLRIYDAALDQYALENMKGQGSAVSITDLAEYTEGESVTTSTSRRRRRTSTYGVDILGNAHQVGPYISSGVRVNANTKNSLSNATGGDAFWGPFS
jgi:type II secretory pathway pseudopilin PulG